MFRAFGHKSVSVLNGGFRKWLDQGLPTESGKPKPTAGQYTVFSLVNVDHKEVKKVSLSIYSIFLVGLYGKQ